MPNFNQVTIAGHLGRDPELRYIPSGTAVCDLTLAITDRVKSNGEWTDKTTWVDVTLWARTAEVAAEYLKKGSACLISGRLDLETWEKDGQKRSKLKVIADRMQMLGNRSDSPRTQSEQSQEPETDGGFPDELPF